MVRCVGCVREGDRVMTIYRGVKGSHVVLRVGFNRTQSIETFKLRLLQSTLKILLFSIGGGLCHPLPAIGSKLESVSS